MSLLSLLSCAVCFERSVLAAAESRLQFDVFLGHDGIVCENSWNPLVCEIKNDGPQIHGAIEVAGAGDRLRRLEIELPTGTLKRVLMPIFCPSGGYASWSVRLVDGNRRTLADQPGIRPRQHALEGATVLGALCRSPSGLPTIRQTSQSNSSVQPATARMLAQLFPDNCLVLEGLDCIYINTERAVDLKPPQVEALLTWLRNGGNLLIGLEQPEDLGASPWLRDICPVQLHEVRTVSGASALEQWLTGKWDVVEALYKTYPSRAPSNKSYLGEHAERPFERLESDPKLATAPLRVPYGEVKPGGTVVVQADGVPLVVSAPNGLGSVTLLLFSPEREPVRSWRNLPVLWARLARVPGRYYVSSDMNYYHGWRVDSVFNAMLSSRQAKKLPLASLLFMLFVYLVVIGPIDYLLVRRLRRPMLTWITFPVYAAGFSALIYLVGFKLRAGDLEWNELHLVDVPPAVLAKQPLRGRSYGNLYSPANKTYQFLGPQGQAVFRGDNGGMYGAAGGSEVSILQVGESFSAQATVPVWASQLFVSDWVSVAPPPFSVRAKQTPGEITFDCQNRGNTLISLACVVSNRIVKLGDVKAHASQTFHATTDEGTPLPAAIAANRTRLQNAVQAQQMAFGRSAETQHLDDWMFVTELISFPWSGEQNVFLAPSGVTLADAGTRKGSLVIFASAERQSPVGSFIKFSPRRTRQMTIWRVVLNLELPQS